MRLFGWDFDPFKKDEGVPCGNSACDTKTKVYRRFKDGNNYCARCQPPGEDPEMSMTPEEMKQREQERLEQIHELEEEARRLRLPGTGE